MLGGTLMMFLYFFISEEVMSEPIGDHVCQKEQRYKVNATRYVLRNITVRSYQWCMQVPPRCSVYAIQQINVTEIQEEDKVRYINECCDGYYENDSKCLLNSCKSCENGDCTDEGTCRCNRGYWGIYCEKECYEGPQNNSCRNECYCSAVRCDFRTENCICPQTPVRCDLVCSGGNAGNECFERCACNGDYAMRTGALSNITTEKNTESSPVYHRAETSPPLVETSTEEESAKGEDDLTESTYLIKAMGFTTSTEKNAEEIDYVNSADAKVSSYISTQRVHTTTFNNNKNGFLNDSFLDTEEVTASSHKVIIDSHLFITIISGALFSVLIIMCAAVFCVLHKLKEKKKKFVNNVSNEDGNKKIKDCVSSVTVTTKSIFHTPLPEPPIFENPAFQSQIEPIKQSFETHVVCNMNMPPVCNRNSQIKSTDQQELFYDRPPSVRSIRPVSVTTTPNKQKTDSFFTFDPIYDEIPSSKRAAPISALTPPYVQEHSALYMNTK